jgi:RecA/RadA recombinase
VISWKYSFKRLNEEYEIAKKKKQALDNLYETGKISLATRDSFNSDINAAIVEIEKQQRILVDKMQSKTQELSNQIKTLETLLANFEIQHVVGEIDEDIYAREITLISTSLDTAKTELEVIKQATNQLSPPTQTVETPIAPAAPEPIPATEPAAPEPAVPIVEAAAVPLESTTVVETPQIESPPIVETPNIEASAEATSTEQVPIEAAIAEAAPVESTPEPVVEVAPVTETPAVEPAPLETGLVETAPVEVPVIEVAAVEPAPVETVPLEAAPVESVPVEEAAPIESAPVMEISAPVEAAPTEPAPVEAEAVEEPAIVEAAPITPPEPEIQIITEPTVEIATEPAASVEPIEEPGVNVEAAAVIEVIPEVEQPAVETAEESQVVESTPESSVPLHEFEVTKPESVETTLEKVLEAVEPVVEQATVEDLARETHPSIAPQQAPIEIAADHIVESETDNTDQADRAEENEENTTE